MQSCAETEIDKGTKSGVETLPEKSNTSKSEIVALQQTKREEVDQAPKPQDSRGKGSPLKMSFCDEKYVPLMKDLTSNR